MDEDVRDRKKVNGLLLDLVGIKLSEDNVVVGGGVVVEVVVVGVVVVEVVDVVVVDVVVDTVVVTVVVEAVVGAGELLVS